MKAVNLIPTDQRRAQAPHVGARRRAPEPVERLLERGRPHRRARERHDVRAAAQVEEQRRIEGDRQAGQSPVQGAQVGRATATDDQAAGVRLEIVNT